MIKDVKEAFVKVYNFVQREFAYSTQIDNTAKYIPYGPIDNLPNKLADLVEGSPTATACLSTLTDFITGEGFNEGEDLENLVINTQGLKFFQFHNIMADSFAHNWGVASIIKYNKVGGITQVYPIPFGYCRLGKPDDNGVISTIHYNPYFGTALYRQKDTEIYDAYNYSAAPVQAQGKGWKGQIYWCAVRDSKNPFYPVPDYYSAQHWMNVEKNAALYFDENLENGFLQSAIIKMIGDPNDPSGVKEGDQDITKGKMFSDMMSKDFSGAKRNAKLMAFWGNNKEEWPEVVAFPTNANADTFRLQDDQATKKITIATKVVAILANISEGVSLGGDGNTIRAAVKLQQQRAVRPQDFLLAYYQEILSHLVQPYTEQITIIPYNPFPELESVDPQVWEVLTPEEKRKWVQDHTEIELIEEEDVNQEVVPRETENRITNLHFDTYPDAARKNVERSLKWQEKMNQKCSKTAGLAMSNMILEGRPLGPKDIRRLSRYLSKKTVFKDAPYDQNCESVLYDAWGGSEMMVWANEKAKELHG